MFEEAVEAVIAGDAAGLREMLRAHPELVRARSAREHRSTLLHYVSANGVEDERQRTPPNILEIARMLLDAGADVNAESEAYGGGSTTLMLAATSYHPEAAGVQIALMELLLERRAAIDGPGERSTVNACLRNGRGMAAEFLAGRGAWLDLEGAAGVGRLDLVKQLIGDANRRQVLDGFAWACEFGHTSVVDFLLQHGVGVNDRLQHGTTGLHWAAYEAREETVALLLERGADATIVENRWGGTPTDWAQHGRAHRETSAGYDGVLAMLRRSR